MSNLPANIGNIKSALAASIGAAGAATGTDLYAGMDRYGTHYYGPDRTEIVDEDQWVVNILGSSHGYTAWGDEARGTKGQNVGEVMVPITQPMPLESELPEVKGDWAKCIGLQMRCLDGEDKGVQILWKSKSHGGRKAYSALMAAVMDRIGAEDPACFPVVQLKSDSYNHKEYGKIFTPEFEIVGWVTMDGEAGEAPAEKLEEPEKEPEPAAKEDAPPPRRRRRKAA